MKKTNKTEKPLNGYTDCHCFIITADNGGKITKADKCALDGCRCWAHAAEEWHSIHFHVDHRDEIIIRLANAKLTKKMTVVEITDKQYGDRFKHKETIKGTGIFATKMQLDRALRIG